MDAIESIAELAIPSDAPQKARNRKTYASFGEDGLTATANAYGHLIQITRYFGNEPSGFICVDLPKTPEPYHITERMKELQRSCEVSQGGMKLQLLEQLDEGNQRPDDLKWGSSKRIPKIRFYQDRWPCFITRYQWLISEIQYFISGKTVYQIYTFSSVNGMEDTFPKEFPPLTINANLLLRHLDFVTEEKPENCWNRHSHKQNEAEDDYEHGTSANADTIFIKHKGCKTSRGKEDAILSISPYINDSLQSISRIGESANYEIEIPEQAKKDLLKNARVKITLAYTLELVSSADAVKPPLSKLELEQLTGIGYRPPVFVDDKHLKHLILDDKHLKHLNFTLRRNLEHILSVCSIPIPKHEEPKDEVIPIALTCGDISGHRIAKEASFHAFNFLLKAFRHFDNCGLKHPGGQRLNDHPLGLKHATCENYNCRMRFRIWKTCLGHLAWISNRMNTRYTISKTAPNGTTEEIEEQGFVRPHYWASGQVIDGWKDNPGVFFDREIKDAPLQMIKFGEFCRITGHKYTIRNVPAGLKSIVKYWVNSLHERNKRGAYAFPRIREEETRKFYLADHALIWWASKSMEGLGLGSKLEVKLDNFTDASEQRTIKYSSDEIKTNFIKRFTMENPASRTRMIAISRSSAETRFSLLIRETVLFYAIDLGLFDVEGTERTTSTYEANEALDDIWENVIVEWINTVDYQTQREDQHDADWDNPLQFALSKIMSTKNKDRNPRLAAYMFEHSRLILLGSSSPNGLFPGQLDAYQIPTLFKRKIMRDSYWQTTFEVPFILWKYLMPPPLVKRLPVSISESASSDIRLLENIIKLLPGMNTNGIPNNVIDQGKVVMLSDEWLYNELDCFKNHIDLSEHNIEKLSENYTYMTDMVVIRRAAKEIQDTIARVWGTTPRDTIPQDITLQGTATQDTQKNILGYILDIPQKSDGRQDKPKLAGITSIESLTEAISPRRTTKNAKKRLLHFCRATDKIAFISYISAFGHPDVSSFFDRHRAYTKFFQEETNAVLNLWVTELHLSFYQIISHKIPSDITCIPDFEYYNFPRSKNKEVGNHKQISRAVMSFRFDGDFFDRHWTCLFFEFNPSRIHANEIFDITKKRVTGSLKADPWKQRRVLELVLFGKILQEMVSRSQVLLDEIKASILEGITNKIPQKQAFSSTFLDSIDIFDEMTSNMFKSSNKSWNLFQYILQVVEEDLAENLTKIELWMKREERPEHNKPRWTLNNERNYRSAIYRLQKSNDLLVQDLTLCYNRAQSFNASLRKGLESARDEWEVESNDDIRLFTYVTVVFLPISFATGVFSMSSAPAKETLNSMITTAGLALLATVIALLYAKFLYSKIVQPFFAALRLILRLPIYAVGLLFRLVYLIFISMLSILPGKWIHLLGRYLISPTEESSSRFYSITSAPKHFLDEKIHGKNKQIQQILVDEDIKREKEEIV